MPSQNPLFSGGWSIKKFNATIINDIWPEVSFFTLVATMVVLVSKKTSHELALSNQLLTVVGTVLGLVISFRTSTAYERYQDGRKMWTNITIASRNISQMIWIHVPFEREDKDKQRKQTILESTIEKKSFVNLVQAFSVSVKHYLRGEPGVYYRDLYPLVCILPRYATENHVAHTDADLLPIWHASEDEPYHDTTIAEYPPGQGHKHVNPRAAVDEHTYVGHTPQRTASLPNASHHTSSHDEDEKPHKTETNHSDSWIASRRSNKKAKKFDPEQALPQIPTNRPLKPARAPPSASFYDYLPFLRFFKWVFRRASSTLPTNRNLLGRKKKPVPIDSNVPLEIMLFLSSYSAWLMRSGLVQPAIATGISNNITMLQDTFSNLDRIRNTPLPFAYQAHLRMSLWLYLFFLPFQVYKAFDYLTIPAIAFASFLFLGFLEIGQEIENPFNYDANDLDLDHFCLQIQRELHEITAHTTPDPTHFVFSAWNQPFAPADRRTAEELVSGGAKSYSVPEMKGHEGEFGDNIDDHTISSLRLTMLRGYRNVDKVTRDS